MATRYATVPPGSSACDNAAIMSFSFGAAGDGRLATPPAASEGFFDAPPSSTRKALPPTFTMLPPDPERPDAPRNVAYHNATGYVINLDMAVWSPHLLYEPNMGFLLDRTFGTVVMATREPKPNGYATVLDPSARIKAPYRKHLTRVGGYLERRPPPLTTSWALPQGFTRADISLPAPPAPLPAGFKLLPRFLLRADDAYYHAYHPRLGYVLSLGSREWLSNLLYDPKQRIMVLRTEGVYLNRALIEQDSAPGSVLDIEGRSILPRFASTLVRDPATKVISLKTGAGEPWSVPAGFVEQANTR
jgi:hypothetical protein